MAPSMSGLLNLNERTINSPIIIFLDNFSVLFTQEQGDPATIKKTTLHHILHVKIESCNPHDLYKKMLLAL